MIASSAGPHRTVTTHTVYSDSDLGHLGFKPKERGGGARKGGANPTLEQTLLKLCILDEMRPRILLEIYLKSITGIIFSFTTDC